MRSTSLASWSTPGSSVRRKSSVWDIRRSDVVSLSLYSSESVVLGWEGAKGRVRSSVGRRVGCVGDMYVEYRYRSRPNVRYKNELGARKIVSVQNSRNGRCYRGVFYLGQESPRTLLLALLKKPDSFPYLRDHFPHQEF